MSRCYDIPIRPNPFIVNDRLIGANYAFLEYEPMKSCMPDEQIKNNITEILANRKETHGDYEGAAVFCESIKLLLRSSPEWNNMTPGQHEALEMIASKMSRICFGNPHETDHWDDIAGYALLGSRLKLRLREQE